VKQSLTGELIAEFLGTALLVLLGDAVVATATIFDAYGGQWHPSILWGLTVAMLVYIFGGVSGAHFNPAVTLGVGFFGSFPKSKILPFIIAQVAGGFFGASVLYGIIGPKIVAFEAANNIIRGGDGGVTTARIFSCYPGDGVTVGMAFFIEIVLTMMLLLIVFAIGDERNSGMPKHGLGPLVVGLVVALAVGIGGPWTMASLNPARDLGPRLFMSVAGWGANAIPGPNGYFWVPSLGPIAGGLLAGVIWKYMVSPFLPAKK